MNAFQILEQIMEAIADGRKPSETTAQFRDRKADELQQHFDDKARVAQQEERVAHKQAIKAKKEYKQNPSSETGQNMANTAIKALDKSMATTSAERKADKIKQIKGKIDWRKSMSEALDIMEEILNALDEDIHSAIDKKYPKESGKNKELHRVATQAKFDAEDVAREHAIGKRPKDKEEVKKSSGLGWDIVDIPMQTPEQVAYDKKAADHDYKQIKKEFTNNKIGDNKTRSKQFPKSYKDVGVLGEPNAKELETERAARKALGKRKAKMNKNEALELMEEIINLLDEDLFNQIRRVHGEPRGDNKARQLFDKVRAAKDADRKSVPLKGSKDNEYTPKVLRNSPFSGKDSKNRAGENKTAQNQDGYGSRWGENGEGAVKSSIERHNKKVSKTHEALELMEQICDFADNLFELDYEEKQNISPNKITKVKKDKNGEKVEVVSVADELFPYSGSAKEQFNKKVLDKINDMIEGTGSLEDLIQFVRKGVATKKAVHEAKEPNKECEYRKAKWEEATQKYFDTKKKNMDFEGKHPETKKAYDEERKAYANLDKARRDPKKINGPFEALEEIKNVAEGLFVKDNRGDLLDDIDTALGSPVKKKLKDIKAKMTGCKETKVHEAFDLMEEIINEISDELAHAASAETTKRYDAARNAISSLKARIKNKDFYTKDEIKDMKKDLKDKETEFDEVKRKRIRDNHNQLNRDIRLGKV